MIQPDERIHLGELARQLLTVALRETAADYQLLARLPPGFKDRVYRFLLCRLDETAGVYHQHVGLIGISRDLEALRRSIAEHDLGIHQILRAAETNHADLWRPVFTGNHAHQTGYRMRLLWSKSAPTRSAGDSAPAGAVPRAELPATGAAVSPDFAPTGFAAGLSCVTDVNGSEF